MDEYGQGGGHPGALRAVTWLCTGENRKKTFPATNNKRLLRTSPQCSSYTPSAKGNNNLLFYITGKSRICISEDDGCSCRNCPVTRDPELLNRDLCLKGSDASRQLEREIC
jgi:hypothetical protein